MKQDTRSILAIVKAAGLTARVATSGLSNSEYVYVDFDGIEGREFEEAFKLARISDHALPDHRNFHGEAAYDCRFGDLKYPGIKAAIKKALYDEAEKRGIQLPVPTAKAKRPTEVCWSGKWVPIGEVAIEFAGDLKLGKAMILRNIKNGLMVGR